MNEIPPRPRRARSILAILAGLVTIFAVTTAVDLALHATGVFPPMGQPMSDSLWLLAIAYRCAIAIAGCWLTARLAPERPMGHALILGGIGVVISLLGVAATLGKGPEFGPLWYPLSLVVTALPCAWLGGRLAGSRAPRTA